MSFGESIAPLLGRFVLSWFYFTQTMAYARDWNGTTTLMTFKNLPLAPVLLFFILSAVFLGALSLLLGFKTKIGALTLFTVTVAASVSLHDYWHLNTAAARAEDYDVFARNIAISGGLLVLIGTGPGKFALDNSSGGGGGGGGGKRR